MKITVEEIKKKKSELESEFLKKLKSFEKLSEISIEYVDVKIDRHDYEEREESKRTGKKLHKLKGVLDVQINVNISNDPRSIDLKESY